jgi:hypothetical protein
MWSNELHEVVCTLDTLIQQSETLDWWNSERFRVDQECRAALQRYVAKATERIDALTPVQSNIVVFSRRLERSLRDAAAESMSEIEGAAAFDGLGYDEGAALAAGGVMAAGGLGAAAAATGTTATAILGLFSTGTLVTFSLPVFSAAAAVALVASYTSPAIIGWATSSLRDRYKAHIEEWAARALVADEATSVRTLFLDRLDIARDRRLAALEELT